MQDREPTIRSRELGDGLRKAMVAAGFNGRQLGQRLDWPDSKVSRLLNGKRGGQKQTSRRFWRPAE
ncbi:MAG: family transcriptional regulator [Amycolatopsis sp.]|uniref:helix-turn-helix domain-containing protein n=1 Tax=Amycolatopsis sp. TaxID=37632 RepID=UPI0026203A37|nr:helix-turn-helix domain-containing protein [Amycolatopsis sp.]MCU1683700.1 family transcriptional regulator [Amycolatopsis sp.]